MIIEKKLMKLNSANSLDKPDEKTMNNEVRGGDFLP